MPLKHASPMHFVHGHRQCQNLVFIYHLTIVFSDTECPLAWRVLNTQIIKDMLLQGRMALSSLSYKASSDHQEQIQGSAG